MISRPTTTIAISGGQSTGDQNAPVSRVGNHVYFYCPVTSQTVQELIMKLREADQELAAKERDLWLAGTYLPIWLHVNSDGGELPSGLAAADIISLLKTPVYTVIEGWAASAASLITMAGKVRYALPNSMLMIHQLSQFVYGTHQEHVDNMEMQKLHMLMLRRFYASHSKLTADDVDKLLLHDSWFDPAEMIHNGFVDAILSPGTF